MTYGGDPEATDFDDVTERRCIVCTAWTSYICEGCDEPVCGECEEHHFERVHGEAA